MNKYWKVSRIILSNLWIKQHYITRSRRLLQSINRKFFHLPKLSSKSIVQICIGSSIIPHGKINVEDDLRKAVEEGETAIISLMNELKELVIKASKEYRTCLGKQIELIKKTGDEASAELPKFRTLAHQLSDELNEYVVLLKTIGEIAYEQTMISMMVDKKSLERILKKYKELEILLLQEFEANKRKELELLEVSISSINAE